MILICIQNRIQKSEFKASANGIWHLAILPDLQGRDGSYYDFKQDVSDWLLI